MREKGEKKGKINFFQEIIASEYIFFFFFFVGLNTVSVIQIKFTFSLFISYHWTSGTKFST